MTDSNKKALDRLSQGIADGVADGTLKGTPEYDDYMLVRNALSMPAPEVATVEDISKDIELWRFSDDTEGTFGRYLAEKYPNGLKIKKDE